MITPEFEERLKKSLSEKNFTEEQKNDFISSLNEAHNEEIKLLKEMESQQGATLIALALKALENPNIANVFNPHWTRLLYKFLIALLLVGSVVLLSWMKVFQASEASTLLGGIVGYMLGNNTK